MILKESCKESVKYTARDSSMSAETLLQTLSLTDVTDADA